MKVLFFLAAILMVTLAEEDKYTTKYDNVDIDEILKNERLLKGYVECLMDRGPCTPDGKELKNAIPDALTNKCQKCSDRQKDGTEKVIKFLSENKHEIWNELKAKYDPEGKYAAQFSATAEEHNIKV